MIGAFKMDAARAGATADAEPLVADLCRSSPEFAAMWHEGDVRTPENGLKRIRHPRLGDVVFETSVFAVDGRSDLSMVVFAPVENADASS